MTINNGTSSTDTVYADFFVAMKRLKESFKPEEKDNVVNFVNSKENRMKTSTQFSQNAFNAANGNNKTKEENMNTETMGAYEGTKSVLVNVAIKVASVFKKVGLALFGEKHTGLKAALSVPALVMGGLIAFSAYSAMATDSTPVSIAMTVVSTVLTGSIVTAYAPFVPTATLFILMLNLTLATVAPYAVYALIAK